MGHVHADLAAVDAMLDLIADLKAEVARLTACACYPDPRDHESGCPHALALCAEPCAEVPPT